MPASALPGATDLQGVATLDDLRGFLHVGDDVWGAIIHQAGDPGPHIQVVAALPPQVVVQSSVSAVSDAPQRRQSDSGASHSCGAAVADCKEDGPYLARAT